MAGYPFETLGCLLPWSPLLIVFVKPSMRHWLLANRPQAMFLITAVAVTYPSVWLAAGARGRYFMPMYPCLAILAALVVERCTAAGAEWADRLIWRRYLRASAAAILASGGALLVLNLGGFERFAEVDQPALILAAWSVAAALTAGVLVWASLGENSPRPQIAVAVMAGFLGLSYSVVIVNVRVNSANDLAPVVADIKHRLPRDVRLVSFNRVYHRFAYCYGVPIEQVAWPATAADVPDDVEYFCYDLLPFFFDPADSSSATDPPGATARLPFEWYRIAEIPCDPVKRKDWHSRVVIGRIQRAAQPALAASNRTADDPPKQSPAQAPQLPCSSTTVPCPNRRSRAGG